MQCTLAAAAINVRANARRRPMRLVSQLNPVMPKNALSRQYERLFDMEGVKLRFTEDALRAVAEEAHRRKSGARGLRAILEEVMLDVMYEIPSLTGVTECVVNREVVISRGRPLLVREKKAS